MIFWVVIFVTRAALIKPTLFQNVNIMKLTGLIAASHTPFHGDFSLNLNCVPEQAAHLAANGVAGAFVAGTTGECHSLTTDERAELFAAWGEAARAHGVKFIAHIGHNNLPDARALAVAAQRAGADAISAMAPIFFKPKDAAALVDWFAHITEPAREMPFYFYDIPVMTGVTIDTTEFVERAADELPAFAGVKYTNTDREQLRRILEMDGAPDMLFGCDEELLEGWELGCRGAAKLYVLPTAPRQPNSQPSSNSSSHPKSISGAPSISKIRRNCSRSVFVYFTPANAGNSSAARSTNSVVSIVTPVITGMS
jgi:dihydrodipicolinate synthase/N-acetylneuraminate lyase